MIFLILALFNLALNSVEVIDFGHKHKTHFNFTRIQQSKCFNEGLL